MFCVPVGLVAGSKKEGSKMEGGQAMICRDCVHLNTCKWLLQRQDTDVPCDWEPSKFKEYKP